MLAEWNVELGADDPELELPWSTPDGANRFLDLKRQPELLLEVPEACLYPELAEFLGWASSPDSPIETAKCDAWTSRQMTTEDEVFGERCKFGSYVDFLFTAINRRDQFADHERFVQDLSRLLRHAPEIASAAEFIVRRCLDRRGSDPANADCYYITFYLYGYGEDEEEARKRWGIALKMVQNAIIQQSSTRTLFDR
jgi:hypothetical protein